MNSLPRQTSGAIVGGGPVGLVLALLLDRHGVSSVVFNTELETRYHPKGNTHNARTMEHYRRLGLSERIRTLGLPPEHPRDVAYFNRYAGWELARIRLPSERDRMHRAQTSAVDDQVPEPLLRANQMYVERLLLEHASTRPLIELRFGFHVHRTLADAHGVTVHAEGQSGREEEVWRAPFLVGCDGGRSFVRRSLGIGYAGESGATETFLSGRMISSHVRVPALHRDLLRERKGWLYNVVAPDLRMLLISLDGADEFLLMSKAEQGEAPSPTRVAATIQRGAGASVPVEVLAQREWNGGAALVAEQFRVGRVLLAGDASHLFSPTGGFGMNTGIDGAANLAWKLAACVQGWASPNLLASYEAERRPVAERNTRAARALTVRVGEVVVPAELERGDEVGSAARAAVGRQLQGFRDQFTSLGVELGARYDGSPLICTDGEAPPRDELCDYVPSAVPGGRLPHLWRIDASGARRSLFDDLGVGFTLLRIGPDAPRADDLVTCARRQGIPLRVLCLPEPPAWSLYQRRLVLVRPDQHIAWRGDHPPARSEEVLARVVGAEA